MKGDCLNFRMKTKGLFYSKQDFLFLLWFYDLLCFAGFNIFVWFRDISDVAMNLNFAENFSEDDNALFQPVDVVITKRKENQIWGW